MANIHANGKLLLTGEYFVLDGAKSLSLPCQLGQTFRALVGDAPIIRWQSIDHLGKEWFKGTFTWPNGKYISGTDQSVGNRLEQILGVVSDMVKADANSGIQGWDIKTQLEFPGNWGLGSSSTLIAAIAQWQDINPYELLENTFGGSGYDIACAVSDGPILYQRKQPHPIVTPVSFIPSFHDQLYFVYLGKKQNSREGIARYREAGSASGEEVQRMNKLTIDFLAANTLGQFEALIREHEGMVAEKIKLERAKSLHFSDFWLIEISIPFGHVLNRSE